MLGLTLVHGSKLSDTEGSWQLAMFKAATRTGKSRSSLSEATTENVSPKQKEITYYTTFSFFFFSKTIAYANTNNENHLRMKQ